MKEYILAKKDRFARNPEKDDLPYLENIVRAHDIEVISTHEGFIVVLLDEEVKEVVSQVYDDLLISENARAETCAG